MIGCWQEQSQLHGEFVAGMGRISFSGDWAKAFPTQGTRPCTEGQEHVRHIWKLAWAQHVRSKGIVWGWKIRKDQSSGMPWEGSKGRRETV